jgi:hypothetical protein
MSSGEWRAPRQFLLPTNHIGANPKSLGRPNSGDQPRVPIAGAAILLPHAARYGRPSPTKRTSP